MSDKPLFSDRNFIAFFRAMEDKVHQTAIEHGWWDNPRSDAELLLLIHSEVSEACEALRKGDQEQLVEELADVIIRIMDMAAGRQLDVAGAIVRKNEVNRKRDYRHGDKKF